MNTQLSLFFYQSAIVNKVKVDLNDPLHKELFDLVSKDGVAPENIKKATKLMKSIPGFTQGISLTNTPAWSSDLFIKSWPSNHA